MTNIDVATASRFLADVQPLWRGFWFHMHLMVKSLRECEQALGKITDDVYKYHMSGHNNDLSRWVQEVIGDAELANKLRDLPTPAEAAKVVGERVRELEGVIKDQ